MMKTVSTGRGYHPARRLLCAAMALAGVCAGPALAAEVEESSRKDSRARSAVGALMEEVVVTARKRGTEDLQDVPIAVTAFGADQLDALNFRDIGSVGFSIPNVALDDNGATPGFQNFSIRGLGVNSGSPSIDPTVGVFIDGIYLGTNAGVLLDNFDLEALEVLRGPQGVLFGRNVTGGAVLVRTKAPGDELAVSGRMSYESGPQMTSSGSVSGPLVEGVLNGKLAMYYKDDDGLFDNTVDGGDLGQSHQFTVRTALQWMPSEDVDVLLRYEHTDAQGDGPVTQNRALHSRDSFDVSINEPGFSELEVDALTAELNWDLAGGTLTNIMGWREITNDGLGDIDGTPMTSFHFYQITEQEQFSNELRFSGSVGEFDITTGLYYFTQDLKYVEERILGGGAVLRGGGGEGTTDVYGVFASTDWHATDEITVNAGVRFTKEEKDVEIGTIRTGGGSYLSRDFVADFVDTEEWSDVSPRLGIEYQPTADTNLYATFSRGFRSGGYNFRSTVAGAPPGPFDAETQDSYEIGLKQTFMDGRARLNVAAFHNTLDDIQREVQVPISGVGIAQLIQNAGEVRIQGFEIDGQITLGDNVLIGGFVGYIDDEYQTLSYDLNGDGQINSQDFGLQLPRAMPWSYGINVVMDTRLGSFGAASARISWSHRDKAYHLENNLGFYNPVDMLDFNINIFPDDSALSFSLFGKNMLDEVPITNDAVLPDIAMFGGDGAAGPRPLPTFSAFGKGRVVGVEVKFDY